MSRENGLGSPTQGSRSVYSGAVTERTTLADEDERLARIQRRGRWLIFLGVLVWGVWLVVELMGGDPHVRYFLPLHLGGVIPGSIMSRWGAIRRRLNRRY